MVNLPLAQAAPATSTDTPTPLSSLPPRPHRCANSCCPGYRRQRPWTGEQIAQLASNFFVLCGTITALIFAIGAVHEEGIEDYAVLTIFVCGGTIFGGGCLLALINVSWLSRRPGVRFSAIQVICNVVLILITSYLELLFWPYPSVAYAILFTAGFPMLIMINLPSCFMKKYPDFHEEGGTVCLDEDAMDDATIMDQGDIEAQEQKKGVDDTQRTSAMEDDIMDIAEAEADPY